MMVEVTAVTMVTMVAMVVMVEVEVTGAGVEVEATVGVVEPLDEVVVLDEGPGDSSTHLCGIAITANEGRFLKLLRAYVDRGTVHRPNGPSLPAYHK